MITDGPVLRMDTSNCVPSRANSSFGVERVMCLDDSAFPPTAIGRLISPFVADRFVRRYYISEAFRIR